MRVKNKHAVNHHTQKSIETRRHTCGRGARKRPRKNVPRLCPGGVVFVIYNTFGTETLKPHTRNRLPKIRSDNCPQARPAYDLGAIYITCCQETVKPHTRKRLTKKGRFPLQYKPRVTMLTFMLLKKKPTASPRTSTSRHGSRSTPSSGGRINTKTSVHGS